MLALSIEKDQFHFTRLIDYKRISSISEHQLNLFYDQVVCSIVKMLVVILPERRFESVIKKAAEISKKLQKLLKILSQVFDTQMHLVKFST